jgi:hypothetical protein
MGHATQSFRGRHVRLHDQDLRVAVRLMADCAAAAETVAPEVARHLVTLEDDPLFWAPGCIQLRLDEVLDAPARVEAFLAALTAAEQLLGSLGDVPAAYLNDRWQLTGPSAHERQYPRALIWTVFSQLRALVSGDGGG